MIWAKWNNPEQTGTPEIMKSPKGFKDDSGVSHPESAFSVWTPDELAAVGWYELVRFVVPEGEGVVSYSYSQSGLQIVEDAVTEIVPLTPAPTNAELIDRFIIDVPALLGIIRLLAVDKGVTETDVINNIKAQVPDA